MSDVPAPDRQQTIDAEHLKLLSIFYYIVGGMIMLISCFALFYVVFGLLFIFMPESMQNANHHNDPPPKFFGAIFALFGTCGLVFGWSIGLLTIYTGGCIKRREHRFLTLIVAGLQCMWIPFGTALGVFTFIVLFRDSVITLYAKAANESPRVDNP